MHQPGGPAIWWHRCHRRVTQLYPCRSLQAGKRVAWCNPGQSFLALRSWSESSASVLNSSSAVRQKPGRRFSAARQRIFIGCAAAFQRLRSTLSLAELPAKTLAVSLLYSPVSAGMLAHELGERSTEKSGQISDEKHGGFLPCARIRVQAQERQAHRAGSQPGVGVDLEPPTM